jgi:hypothetical protein
MLSGIGHFHIRPSKVQACINEATSWEMLTKSRDQITDHEHLVT